MKKIYHVKIPSDIFQKKSHKVWQALVSQLNFFFNAIVPGKPEVFIEQTGVTVYVSWTLKHKNGFVKNYHVTYIRKDDSSDSKSLATNKTKQHFEDLKAGKTYEFQVGNIFIN